MTTETNNARGEWPARYACNGPEGTFWTDDATLANKLIAAAFDRDEWTVTDTQNPTAPEPEIHSYDPTDQRESVTIRWPDGKCLGYVLDRTRYTDNLPPERAQQQPSEDGERDWLAEAMDALAEWRFDALKQED